MIQRLLLASALLVIGIGVFLFYYQGRPDEPTLVLEEPNRVFQDLVAGRECDFEFRVVNHGGRTGRIVGLSYD